MNATELHMALKRLDVWPHAVKRQWASRVTADFYLRKGYVTMIPIFI